MAGSRQAIADHDSGRAQTGRLVVGGISSSVAARAWTVCTRLENSCTVRGHDTGGSWPCQDERLQTITRVALMQMELLMEAFRIQLIREHSTAFEMLVAGALPLEQL
jgi:hypothetical protein